MLGYKKDDIITMLDNGKPDDLQYPSKFNIVTVTLIEHSTSIDDDLFWQIKAMRQLSTGAKPGDRIVFHCGCMPFILSTVWLTGDP